MFVILSGILRLSVNKISNVIILYFITNAIQFIRLLGAIHICTSDLFKIYERLIIQILLSKLFAIYLLPLGKYKFIHISNLYSLYVSGKSPNSSVI